MVEPGSTGHTSEGVTHDFPRATPGSSATWNNTRTQLKREWDGPLCVTQAERTLSELKSIQHRLSAVPGMRVLDSGINEMADQVECDVVVLDHAQQMLDDRFGAGAVLATPALTPVG